jgi:hypothetical protein
MTRFQVRVASSFDLGDDKTFPTDYFSIVICREYGYALEH